MRYLCIDLCDVRTGLASGDDITRIVQPLVVIEERDEARRLAKVAAAVEDHGPDRLVVGLPLNMDDSEGPRAENVRAFGARIEAALQATRLRVPEVTFWDERLTTKEADALLVDAGYTGAKRKERRDSWAALVILRDWLETNE